MTVYEHFIELDRNDYSFLGWSNDGCKIPQNIKFTPIFTARNGFTIYVNKDKKLYYFLDTF